MTDQDRNKAWGYALFADDLRAELGGKISLMGIYQSDMLFPSSMVPPFGIPKFVIQVMYFEVAGALQGDVTFRVTFGSEHKPVAEGAVLRKDLANLAEPTEREEGAERIIHIRVPIVLSPFVIAELGRLRVRAHYSDGSMLKLGSIAIRQLPDDEFQATTGLLVRPNE